VKRAIDQPTAAASRTSSRSLSELHALRIDLFLHQQGLDTTTSVGKAMFQMLGVFAEFERSIIAERVRAGLARAKVESKRLGRPPISADLENRSERRWISLAARRACGRSLRGLASTPAPFSGSAALFDSASVAA